MITQFDKELKRLDVFAHGDELCRYMGKDRDKYGKRVYHRSEDECIYVGGFDNPVLITDVHQIAKVRPASRRDVLVGLFHEHIRVTEYDGTRLRFDNVRYNGLWGPSIDTLLFCRALNKVDFTDVRTACEWGAGSGFISKRMLAIAPELRKMYGVDMNRYFADCAYDNITSDRFRAFVGDAIDFSEGKRFDMITCNPPYTRRRGSVEDNAYEGIGLLVYTLKDAPQKNLNPGGRIIINISSLSGITPQIAEEMADAPVRLVDRMTVPLKVHNIVNDPEWVEFLIQNKGLVNNPHRGYDYWHTISIIEVGPVPNRTKPRAAQRTKA